MSPRIAAPLGAMAVSCALSFLFIMTVTAERIAPFCASATGRVHEEGFVSLGGAEQWVTIKGENCANPVILFLHGGPGNTLSPFADAIYGTWAKKFTLVQWDQRGAGRTYGRSRPDDGSTLTLENMAADGVQLAEYLTQRLGQRKIILTGGSWGSILGVQMVKSRPDLFHAYVGVAQIVSYRENQTASYAKLVELAGAAKDEKTISALENLRPPPWTNPRNSGILRRATRVYEAKTTTPAPVEWWVRSRDYDSPEMRDEYVEGEDYSYLQFVGLEGDGMFSQVDLPRLGPAFEIPVFIIHGAEDLVARPEVAKRYFDSIKAPQKEFVIVPNAGHDPNEAMIDAHYRLVSERIGPLRD